MLWLTILLTLFVAVVTIYYVAQPLWLAPVDPLLDDDHPLSNLLQRKDNALHAIKELEFDYQTGKLSEDDFQRGNQRLRQQAIILLRQIEQHAPASSGLDVELETAIAQLRKTK